MLGGLAMMAGDARARTLLRSAVELTECAVPNRSRHLSAALDVLAKFERKWGNVEEALRLFRRAIETEQDPSKQPYTQQALANTLRQCGQTEQADALEDDVIVASRLHGLSIVLIITLANKHNRLSQLGQFQAARELLRELHTTRARSTTTSAINDTCPICSEEEGTWLDCSESVYIAPGFYHAYHLHCNPPDTNFVCPACNRH